MWGLTLQFWQSVVLWANIVALAGGILTGAALFVSAWVSSNIADVVQQDADQRILEARTRGDEARADAAKANQHASEAAERAAEAEQRAAEANLELARIKAPRTLRPDQQEHVIAMLKPFAGTQFDVGRVQGDAEAAEFMTVIEAVLQAAGWTQIDWVGGDIVMTRQGKPTAGLVTATNVAIAVHPENASTLGNAAATLSSALNLEGIAARAGTSGAGFLNSNAGAVHILVGRKT
jgi:multidrug efflux pump subunit AcrA (membrane-fusion protein)